MSAHKGIVQNSRNTAVKVKGVQTLYLYAQKGGVCTRHGTKVKDAALKNARIKSSKSKTKKECAS
jgi:hypothetical protein